jgi:bacteriorhodopsin
MLLLVFLLAMRCALDTWDFAYYPLPFVLALLTWESLSFRRPPVFSLVASPVVWLLFVEAPGHLTPDQMALVFAALALPTMGALAVSLYGGGVRVPRMLSRASSPSSSGPAAAPISTV